MKGIVSEDEFLIRCCTLLRECEAQILSGFRAGHRDDLRTELLVRGVNELELAYALVQDLDFVWISHTSKNHDYRNSMSRPSPYFQLNRSSTQSLHIGMTSRVRVLNGTTETRA